MQLAICTNQNGTWIPILTFEGNLKSSATPKASGFTVGQAVKLNGILFQGNGVVERLDGNDVLVRAANGKLYRYDLDDVANNVITANTDDSIIASTDNDDTYFADKDFELNDKVTINGTLFQGNGFIEKFDLGDVLVRADNGKLYRYNPDDISVGKIKLA